MSEIVKTPWENKSSRFSCFFLLLICPEDIENEFLPYNDSFFTKVQEFILFSWIDEIEDSVRAHFLFYLPVSSEKMFWKLSSKFKYFLSFYL